jgi:hemerythrin
VGPDPLRRRAPRRQASLIAGITASAAARAGLALADTPTAGVGAGIGLAEPAGGRNMALVWDRSLSVGVALIDEQHQELFRRVNALLEAMLKNQGKPEIEKLVAFLAEYAVDHFSAEEKLMAQHRYPAAAAHRQQHADFVKRFGELKARFDAGGATSEVSVALTQFVGSWLRNHIRTTDTALGKHLKALNVAGAAA